MSKHNRDYTKFSNNKPEEKIEPVVEEVVEATTQAPVEEVVEEVAVVEETIKPEVHGVVVDCLKLNVREAPKANAAVVCVVDASSNLVIIEEESTEDFYAVCTASGAEGYCMKQFVKILP